MGSQVPLYSTGIDFLFLTMLAFAIWELIVRERAFHILLSL